MSNNLQNVTDNLQNLATKLDQIAVDNEKFNDKFDRYQKTTQWLVQLALTLIASATLTVIVTAILQK